MSRSHPMLVRLRDRYPGKNPAEALDLEAARLREQYRDHLYFAGLPPEEAPDMRRLAAFLGMEELRLNRPENTCHASTGYDNGRLTYSISPNEYGRLPHPYRQRFLIAHEVSHVFLRKSLGPFRPDELAFSREEETLCDLFALALLVPGELLVLEQASLTAPMVYQWCGRFQMPLGLMMERFAAASDGLCLFWRWTANPRRRGSSTEFRIVDLFPRGELFARHYIPYYCTARDERFAPNLVRQALEEEIANHGEMHIRQLGRLSNRRYLVRNIYFRPPRETMFRDEGVYARRPSYNMATLVYPGRDQRPSGSFIWSDWPT